MQKRACVVNFHPRGGVQGFRRLHLMFALVQNPCQPKPSRHAVTLHARCWSMGMCFVLATQAARKHILRLGLQPRTPFWKSRIVELSRMLQAHYPGAPFQDPGVRQSSGISGNQDDDVT